MKNKRAATKSMWTVIWMTDGLISLALLEEEFPWFHILTPVQSIQVNSQLKFNINLHSSYKRKLQSSPKKKPKKESMACFRVFKNLMNLICMYIRSKTFQEPNEKALASFQKKAVVKFSFSFLEPLNLKHKFIDHKSIHNYVLPNIRDNSLNIRDNPCLRNLILSLRI